MCRYRHYYYAGCRHQETILHDYCDRATAAPASPAAHTISPAATSPPPDAQTGGANEDQDATPRPGSPASMPSPSPTMSTSSSSHHTTASNVSIGSSAPTSFASTIEDTSDTASIQLDHPLRRHSEPSACDMAGLPPFVRDNLRQFFSGGQLPTVPIASGPKHVDYEDQENVHPVESAEGDDRVTIDKARNASYGSVMSQDSQYEFDAIERDIDTLKQHIAEMRSASRSGRSTPTMNHDHTQNRSSSTRTRIPGPVVQPRESAAARLQREHEQLEQSLMRPTASHHAKPPPLPSSPHDFPELGRISAERRPRASTADANEAKPSYANMATAGMMDTISKRPTSSKGTHGHETGSSGTASRITRGSFTSSTNPDLTVMEGNEARHFGERKGNIGASPRSPRADHALAARGQTPSLMGCSPRFAQPTKAHSQRAGATMRKDSITSKVSPVSSPTKSARVLPQVQSKRSALPGGWLSSTEVSPTTDASSPSVVGTVDASSPSSKERWQIISHTTKDTASNPEPALRKKTSSYMSPTKATTLRNVATLGQENVKHTSPRIKKPVTHIDTAVSPVSEVVTSATSQGQGSTISGTTLTESAVSSPDVAIYTESRAVDPWTLQRFHTGHLSNLNDLTPLTFQPALREVATQQSKVLRGVGTKLSLGTKLSRAGGEVNPTTSDPASAVFGGGEITEETKRLAECVKTEHALQTSHSIQRIQGSSSTKQMSTGTPSHAVPIVQPKTQKPMSYKPSAPRRSTIGPLDLVVDDLAAKARAAGLPMPANTVAKRRESHGHLLTPITNKLETLGLLKPRSADTNSPLAGQPIPCSLAPQQVRQLPPETPDKSSPSVSAAVPPAPQVRTKAVPPHLRRMTTISSVDETTTDKNTANVLVGSIGLKSGHVELEARGPQIAPLRATAQEFTPMWKPNTIEQELGLLDWEGWFSYRSPEEWNALHPGIRAAIQAIRDYKCKGGRPPSGTFPGMTPTKIRSKTANQRFWANLMQNQSPVSNSDGPGSMTPSDVVAAMQESIAQHHTSGSVATGQVLKPEINPETNAIQWVMQEPDGRKASVNFGRAAAPTAARFAADTFGSPSTVTISPVSTDTSSRYNGSSPPDSAFCKPPGDLEQRGWSIASALKDPSGWALGDGREIRYVGKGNISPGTTHNPVAPFQQGFREGPDQAPRMIGEDRDDGHNSMPLAPRSREQWAKLLPQSRTPCGNIEITQAIEQIPFSSADDSKLYGFCGPCSGEVH